MIFALVSFSTLLPAQKFTLNGYVKDKELSESPIGAAIFQSKTTLVTTANAHGFYSLTLPSESITFLFAIL